jgi:hypothetical protein
MLLRIILFLIVLSAPAVAAETTATWLQNVGISNVVLSSGNSVASGGSENVFRTVRATISRSEGKRCFEISQDSTDAYASLVIGMVNVNAVMGAYPGSDITSFGVQWLSSPGLMQPFAQGVAVSNPLVVTQTATSGTVTTICVNFGTGSVWIARNGAWASGDPVSGSAPTVTGIAGSMFPAVGVYNAANSGRLKSKASEIAYLPSGFISWAENGGTPTPIGPPPGSGIPPDTPYPILPPLWQKVTDLYINTGAARQPVGPGYYSTCWSATGSCATVGPAPDNWHVVDLTASPWNVPATAKWALMEARTTACKDLWRHCHRPITGATPRSGCPCLAVDSSCVGSERQRLEHSPLIPWGQLSRSTALSQHGLNDLSAHHRR